MNTSVSVIVVSDYASGEEKGWSDLRNTLAALAQQDYAGPVEYLLVESSANRATIPDDLGDILPDLKVAFFDCSSSYALKNEGARLVTGEVLGILDGDCAPARGWISALVRTFDEYPDTAVVSGRTIYQSDSVSERILGLLSRGYLDRGQAAATDSIANNNSAFAREALLLHPFLDDIGAFGGKLQTETMNRDGLNFRFEPDMLAVHAYEGWGMEKDIRKQSGYATVMVRKLDPAIEYSWLTRLGPLATPVFFLGRLFLSWKNLLTLYKYYDIPWYSVPRGSVLALYLHWLEIPGIRMAFRGETIEETAYR